MSLTRWRTTGELDVMEAVGTGKTVQTVHQSTNGDLAKKAHEESSVADLTAWHVYVAEREPGVVRWYIDNRLVFTVPSAQAPWLDSALAGPMNMRLNLQVGGSMPSYYGLNVDATTPLPADYVVDYGRVLSRREARRSPGQQLMRCSSLPQALQQQAREHTGDGRAEDHDSTKRQSSLVRRPARRYPPRPMEGRLAAHVV